MAVTRRIIWLNDSEWSLLAKMSEDTGRTISVVVRDLAINAFANPRSGYIVTPQQERDAILRKVNRGSK